VRFTNLRDKFALEFLVQLEGGSKPRAVRIISSLKHDGDSEEKRNKELDIIHRHCHGNRVWQDHWRPARLAA
jgi:hypothetical protein